MDVKIKETGSGGDLVFENGDIQLTSEVYNQPYLAHFGGNKEQTTPEYIEGTERLDYWANALFLPSNEQLNSSFEKMLNDTELSSSGRIKLERAASEDLEFLSGFADTTSSVNITSVDKILLSETVTKNNNENFTYIWSEAKDEIL